jgi:hypothetical protein
VPFSFTAINPLAVLVAGLATFFLGALWYMALFGKLWMRLHGYSEEKVKEMQSRRPPIVFFGGMIAADLIIALALAILLTGLGTISILTGVIAGLLVWVIVAGVGLTAHLAADKHPGLYLIDVSYQLVYLILNGLILAAWR